MATIKKILTKRPFARITYDGHMVGKTVKDLNTAAYYESNTKWLIVSQADFLREYYPTGHRINDPEWYHDQIKYRDRVDATGQPVVNPKTGEVEKDFFRQEVFRCSMPFQMLITAQQTLHLCGRDLRHELTDDNVDKANDALFLEFQKGWIDHNIDVRFFEFVKSVKITGDAAIVFYLNESKACTKVLSYMYGDTLFPQYDSITGKLNVFARKYFAYDEDGETSTEFVEIWDDTYMYRYKKDLKGWGAVKNEVLEALGLEGYVQVEKPQRHGFNCVPVAYKRTDGPCWMFAQDSIDKYEVAMSQLCQNNSAFALPILLLSGDDVSVEGDIYGNVKAFTMGREDHVSYLEQDGHSENFKLQLEILLKMIFMSGFAVQSPEVKSGDLPGVAVKLIYAPSLERANIDAREYDDVVDTIKDLFLQAYGIEQGKMTQYMNLHILTWIDPFVFSSDSEIISNLVQSVGAGIVSKQTASQKTGFDSNSEWERIVLEQKQAQQADRLYQLKQTTPGTEE